MDVKQVVALAKQHVLDLFEEEKITNLGLEEVEFDEQMGEWFVTIGFSRPWDEPRNSLAALAQTPYIRRSYKVVRVSDNTERVLAVKSREVKT